MKNDTTDLLTNTPKEVIEAKTNEVWFEEELIQYVRFVKNGNIFFYALLNGVRFDLEEKEVFQQIQHIGKYVEIRWKLEPNV